MIIRVFESVTAMAQPRAFARVQLLSQANNVTNHLIKCLIAPDSPSAGGWKVELIGWFEDAWGNSFLKGGKRLKPKDLEETIFCRDHLLQIENYANKHFKGLKIQPVEPERLHAQVMFLYKKIGSHILATRFPDPFAPILETFLEQARSIR
jgi:hypothetical protein